MSERSPVDRRPPPGAVRRSALSDALTDPGDDERVAVALEYAPRSHDAPRLVAKGRGEIAEQLIEIAEANGVPIRQDADLATLLSAVEIDQEIPVEAFVAVAELLAYVYQANNRMAEVRRDVVARAAEERQHRREHTVDDAGTPGGDGTDELA